MGFFLSWGGSSPYSCSEDLQVYLKALEECLLQIPPNSLLKVYNHAYCFSMDLNLICVVPQMLFPS